VKRVIASAVAMISTTIASGGGPAPSRVTTFHQLYEVCSANSSLKRHQCKRTLNAIAGALNLHGGSNDPLSICVSIEGIGDAEMVKAIQALHDAHKDLWSAPAADGVHRALHRAFPCR
jgi:hypothetical protein